MKQSTDLWLPPHDFRVRSINRISHGFASTPFGNCVAIATPTHLLALHFSTDHLQTLNTLKSAWPRAKFHSSPTIEALIQRALTEPEKVPVLAVGTPFQLAVWELLRSIRSGTTMTYGEVAAAIGRPGAARAVGRAAGANQISIVIPCHRVVSHGKLTGYRWGVERKKQLLAWEFADQELMTSTFRRKKEANQN